MTHAARYVGIVLLLSPLAQVNAQLTALSGCPLEWQTHGDKCYQFVFDQTKTYQEAATACWSIGSSLVSVNTYQEDRFIATFLGTHARDSGSVWYTSGQFISGYVKWFGDGTFTNRSSAWDSWWNNDLANVDTTNNRIAYKFSGETRTYRWGTETGVNKYNYICEIPKAEVFRIVQQTRDFDYGTNVTDKSSMERGPSFLLVSSDLVVVGKDWPAVMECAASAKPQTVYTWLEATSVYGTQNFGKVVEVFSNDRYTLSGGRMTITKPVETKDSGMFQCKAENKYGSILTQPIRLSFGYLGQFSPNQQGAVEAKRNMGSYMNCIAPSAKPAVVYNWYKDDANNFVRPELNKYLFVSSNGNLYFSEVQDNDGGDYFCVVTLVAGVGSKLSTPQAPSRTSKAIRLIVASNPAQEYGPIIHPDFISVYPAPPMIGYEISMECFAFGRMPLRYSWFREGSDFPPGTYFKYDNRVLVIPKAQLSDSGNYTCKVEKLAGQRRIVYKSYLLLLEAKPYFVVPLRDMHADVDSELTWRCEALAIPRATYSWYKNSKLLDRVPGEIEIRENVLVIKRLNADRDNGMYQCMVTNSHGTSMSSAQLRVLSVKPTFAKYRLPSSMVASQGGNLTIRCTPEAAPAPVITWLHNGQQIGGDGRVEIGIDGTLHLSQITMSDRGRYTCKASNEFGESQSSTEIKVFGGLSFIQKPRPNTIGKVNTTVFLYCEISYDYNSYDLAYVWKFNGRVIDTHRDMFYREGDHAPGLYIINAQFWHSGLYECIGQTVTTTLSAFARVTITGPPSQPAGVYVENHISNNSSMRLIWFWNSAADHGFPVLFFEVEAWTAFSNTWEILLSDIPAYVTVVQLESQDTKRFVEVNNLQPHNSYRFRVRAKNGMGVGPPSTPSEIFRVPAAAPKTAPIKVGGGGGSVGLLCMRWQALRRDQEGGEKFGYIVYWWLTSDKKAVPQQADVGNKTSHCVKVGEKNFYTMYSVQVQPYNSKGVGPKSPVAYAYSAEGMPGIRPTNVKFLPLNATAVYVTWDPVPNTREAVKGRVLGYEIDYWMINSTSPKFNRNFIYCDCGQGMILGLMPNSKYWLQVEVFNSAGKGPRSEKYMALTYLPPPSLFPQYVYIFPHDSHSVRIQWRGVNIKIGEGTILGYKLIYWPAGDDIKTANFTITDTPSNTETIIQGLQQDTIYKLRIMAYSRGGDGRKSPTQYFSILHGGTINVNVNNFDPSVSENMIAASAMPFRSLFTTTILCTLSWLTFKYF